MEPGRQNMLEYEQLAEIRAHAGLSHMSADRAPPSSPPRVTRWSRAPSPPPSNRWLFRLIAIPALAIAGVLVYRGVRDYFFLPECDSSRARNTLAELFKQLKLTPLHYEPIKTISSSKEQVVCNALLPLADDGSINVDYTFFWQGHTANMRYSISQPPAGETPPSPAHAPGG
jgi:hypothetical protein